MRALQLAAAVALAAAAFEPFYLRVFRLDRARLAATLVELPYRKMGGLRQFLLSVRDRTKAGDTIAVWGPMTKWEGGYDYYYGRTLYIFVGRRVLPLLDPQDRPHPEELDHADYIAAYKGAPVIPGFEVVWRGPDGVLLRRVR